MPTPMQDGQATDDALEQHRNQDGWSTRVTSAVTGATMKLSSGALRQVEANQRHNRTGHDRGHELGEPAGAGELNDQANQEQRHTRHDDTAEGARRAVRRSWQPPEGAMNAKEEPR